MVRALYPNPLYIRFFLGIIFLFSVFISPDSLAQERTLLNVSYDPTRELYQDINKAFQTHWFKKTSQTLKIYQSHSGSGKQARSILYGLDADVVTLALAYDINALAKQGFMRKDWRELLPKNSAPYGSAIILLVRKNNPKNIKGWGDLTRSDIEIVTPNPKTSGAARWGYLAAWAWAEQNFNHNQGQIRAYMKQWLRNVAVFDTGARNATTSFTRRGIGDVLVTWENEALMALEDPVLKDIDGGFDMVIPSISIMAEPAVAVVDKNVNRKGNHDLAQAYLEFLYTPQAQALIAQHHYRPNVTPLDSPLHDRFPTMEMVWIDDDFGGWEKAHKTHFADGAIFDQLMRR